MSTDKNCDLSNVILQVNEQNMTEASSKSQRIPKRVLHFSDGDLIEYSDDEETDAPKKSSPESLIDPKTLDWLPWTWHQTTWASYKLLEACDYVGEALAHFLGITSPKYQFEIDEYNRLKKLQAEETRKEEEEISKWSRQHDNELIMNDLKANNEDCSVNS